MRHNLSTNQFGKPIEDFPLGGRLGGRARRTFNKHKSYIGEGLGYAGALGGVGGFLHTLASTPQGEFNGSIGLRAGGSMLFATAAFLGADIPSMDRDARKKKEDEIRKKEESGEYGHNKTAEYGRKYDESGFYEGEEAPYIHRDPKGA